MSHGPSNNNIVKCLFLLIPEDPVGDTNTSGKQRSKFRRLQGGEGTWEGSDRVRGRRYVESRETRVEKRSRR